MTNLKSISDETLLNETKKLVAQERELLTEVLHHLREIERRRLYSSLKYGSLYEYATQCLGYSEDQAYRRIQGARLLKEIPEIEEKINDGSLSLTHLSMAQSLFKREEKAQNGYSKVDKIQILEKFEHTSKREAERIAIALSSTPIVPQEKIRVVSEDEIEVKFVAKGNLADKIKKLKNLLSHKHPDLKLSELMDMLCDLGLEKYDKIESPAPVKVQNDTTTKPSKARIRRNVWKRDKGQCQICNSKYTVEIDHRFPKARGGDDSEENLRLLCRSCNQREAIHIYGQSKMDKYINT